MRNISRLFQPPKISTTATARTAHGLPAFKRPIEEQLLQALLCNTVQDTFYADKNELLEETKRVHQEAIEHDVRFYAQALAYARTRGFMRLQPIYGLALLASRSHDLDVAEQALVTGRDGREHAVSFFEAVFNDVIHTPNDLMDFHSVVRSLKNNDGGRRVKRVAGDWLRFKMSEYWAIKYGGKRDGSFSLRDLYRIYHPAGVQGDQLVNYILGKEGSTLKLPQVHAFEFLKGCKDPSEKVAAIKLGRLPHEVASSFAGKDPKVWAAIVQQMPAFALLRHLATIERNGVLEVVRPLIVEKFTSEGLAKAKIFPFNFIKAMEKVHDGEIKDALRIGLEICLRGSETLPGKTLVALDISGSMASLIDKAALFAVATARRAPGSALILFNTEAHDYGVSRVDSVLTQAQVIRKHLNGGTDQSAITRWLEQKGQRFDNVVVVTDEQQQQGVPFADSVQQWRKGRNGRDTKFFVANLAPYTHAGGLLPAGENNFSVFGLNEQAIQFIAKAANSWSTFVSEVIQGTGAEQAGVADEIEGLE